MPPGGDTRSDSNSDELKVRRRPLDTPSQRSEPQKPSDAVAPDNQWFVPPKYRIICQLGKGGMGEVYKVENVPLGRIEALKVHNKRAFSDERLRERFAREARCLAGLRHEHIPEIYDFEEYRNSYYFTMRYVDGMSLKTWLKTRGTMDVRQVVAVGAQLLLALQYSHANGIIHRDIKPDNILLTKNDIVYLIDFGLVRHDHFTANLTQIDARPGTKLYMAPEQRVGPATFQSDIYALGAVFYEMLSGERAITCNKSASASQWLCVDDVTAREKIACVVPDAAVAEKLTRMCLKALAADCDRRYRSADEWLHDLMALNASNCEVQGGTVAHVGGANQNAQGDTVTHVDSISNDAPAIDASDTQGKKIVRKVHRLPEEEKHAREMIEILEDKIHILQKNNAMYPDVPYHLLRPLQTALRKKQEWEQRLEEICKEQ